MRRRLPIRLDPVHGELTISYIARLAGIHGLHFEELWRQVSIVPKKGYHQRRDVVLTRLAEITGRQPGHLAHALPDLRHPAPDWRQWRHDFQAACTGCAASHPGGPVFLVLPHHRYVCIHHRYWIGPPDKRHDLASLHQLPEVVAAQRIHQRLLRRFGWHATYDAVLTGFLFTGWLWHKQADHLNYDSTTSDLWIERARTMIPTGAAPPAYSTSKLFAAIYPEAIRVAVLIASPRWRSFAHGDDHHQRRFAAEIGRRLQLPDYRHVQHGGAIADWMREDSRKPPIAPTTIFPDTKGRQLPEQLADGHRYGDTIANSRHAVWFSRHGTEVGGSLILRHRHLRPIAGRADRRTEIAD